MIRQAMAGDFQRKRVTRSDSPSEGAESSRIKPYVDAHTDIMEVQVISTG